MERRKRSGCRGDLPDEERAFLALWLALCREAAAKSFGFAELYQLTGEGNIVRYFDSKQRFERFHAGAERYVKPMKKIFH